MNILVTVEPTVKGVSLQEVKSYLRVNNNEDDSILQQMINSAHTAIERYTGRTLIETTRQMILTLKEVRKDIWLPFPPGISVSSVEIADDDDAWSTVPTTNYVTVGTSPMRLVPRNNGWVDSSGNGLINTEQALRVTYKAGYGQTNDEIPDALRQAILVYVKGLYDDTGTTLPSAVKFSALKSTAYDLARSYRYYQL